MYSLTLLLLLLKCIYGDEIDFDYAETTTESLNQSELYIDSDVDLTALNTDVISDYRLHLDSVISAVRIQNWTVDDQQCVDDVMLLLNNVKNNSFWAVWKWDSMNTSPYSVLYGARYELGNFDQCLATPWKSNRTELQSQYCLVDIQLEGTKINKTFNNKPFMDHYSPAKDLVKIHYSQWRPLDEITYGICAPKSCGPGAVEKLTSAIVSSSYLGILDMPLNVKGTSCQDGVAEDYDGTFYAFILTFLFLILFTTTCTFISKSTIESKSLKFKIIEAFSFEKNAKNLLKVKEGDLNVLYGIRYLTMCFIVLGHQLGSVHSGGPAINGRHLDKLILTEWGRIFLHLDILVDTFYMLSGLLTVSNFLSMQRFPNPIILILRRYLRLATGFAVVIFYYCSVYSYMGSGPLWKQLVESEVGPCKRNWWISLLMLNNYINSEDYCIVISWYVPTDFQFFISAVVLWYIYRKSKFTALTAGMLLAIASAVTVGTLTYLHELAPIQPLTHDFLRIQRDNKEFNMTYIKSHTRFAAYFVGLAAGYVLTKALENKNRKRWPKKWSTLGAILSLLLLLVVMLSGSSLVVNDSRSIEGAVYAAINKPIWVFLMAFFVACCSLGTVPIIGSFLSWYPWVPLSRLSYGLYLIHIIIIQRNTFITRQPYYVDFTHVLLEALGVIIFGTIAAFVMWLLFEAPVNNLLTLCIGGRSSSQSEKDTVQKTSTPVNPSNGHFQENLPSAIQISKF